jgi:hypothetical protein
MARYPAGGNVPFNVRTVPGSLLPHTDHESVRTADEHPPWVPVPWVPGRHDSAGILPVRSRFAC